MITLCPSGSHPKVHVHSCQESKGVFVYLFILFKGGYVGGSLFKEVSTASLKVPF